MRMRVFGIAMCAALSAFLTPAAAPAGGPPHRLGVFGAPPGHVGVKAMPELGPPKSAFGSPGGFPFVASERRSRQFLPHRFPRHALFPRFRSTVFLYTPTALYEPPAPVVNVSPVTYVSPAVYVSPTVVLSEPAPTAAAPPPVPPLPQVVEYPTGRYELRGDGTATPYVWVWIPNPPAAPPVAAPAPPDEPSAIPTRRGETYRWTDAEGTTFWTNRRDKVPEAFRPLAQAGSAVESR
jgi:hypothetical protein